MIEIIGTALNQWDTGRSVSVTGASHVHFANHGDSKAVIMELANSQALIPNYLLQTGKQLCVYAVENGVTIERKIFSVKKRERPENYVYDDDQRNYIYELITDAQEATNAANQAATAATQAAQNAVESAGIAGNSAYRANEAAESAKKAAQNANEAAIKAAHTAKSLMVIGGAEGTAIALDDAIDQYLVGCRIFGKTTQDGTPTPDVPVELVSAGDDGSVEVVLHDGNIAESIYATNDLEQYYSALYIETTLSPSTTYTLSFGGTPGNVYYTNENVFDQVWVVVQDGTTTVVMTTKSTLNKGTNAQYHPGRGWIILKNSKKNSDHVFSSVMLNLGAIAKDYEAPKGKQTLSVSTPNGLPGIPVTSGGNYTDANGQQWICDEIDFARGVYVQRIGIIESYTSEAVYGAYMSTSGELSKGATVQYILASTIETPLSKEELAAYAALHTYKDDTTVTNDAGAWMELEYVMDAKKYIDSLVAGGSILPATVE